MNWLTLSGIAIGLAMDAFAVSIAVGLAIGTLTFRPVFRVAFHFGVFKFMMPVLGWGLGSTISSYIAAWDHWLAFGLLGVIGGKMLLGASPGNQKKTNANPTRGWMLLTLSVATSIDALGVGLSLAFLRVPILLPCIVIGIVAALFSTVGITFGSRIGRRGERTANVLGGCMLILIGISMVISHLEVA